MCGLIAIVLACWMFIQIACCRVPRALRRMKTWVDGLYRRFCGPAVADACAQVEIHDLEGTMVPGLKHLLSRFELATAGTRDVLERRIRCAFEGRNRVWAWHLALDAPPRALAQERPREE